MKRFKILSSLLFVAIISLGLLFTGCNDMVKGNSGASNSGGNQSNSGSQSGSTNSGGNQSNSGSQSDSTSSHTHSYFLKYVADTTLASPANCTSAAQYYYSCPCGKKGTSTFSDGKPVHTFNQKNTAEKYLESGASCRHGTLYYFSCKCGEKGNETFEVGEKVHSFTRIYPSNKYLASEGKYYYSCTCGEKGKETFHLSLKTPETKFTFNNWSNPAYFVHTTAEITSISYTVEPGSTTSVAFRFGIQIDGIKTYYRFSGYNKIIIGVKLYDPNGKMIDECQLNTLSIATGESFTVKHSFNIPRDNVILGEYTLKLVEIKW